MFAQFDSRKVILFLALPYIDSQQPGLEILFLVVANFCYQVQDQVAKKNCGSKIVRAHAVISNNFVLSEQLAAAVVLGCVADCITNITQNCMH